MLGVGSLEASTSCWLAPTGAELRHSPASRFASAGDAERWADHPVASRVSRVPTEQGPDKGMPSDRELQRPTLRSAVDAGVGQAAHGWHTPCAAPKQHGLLRFVAHSRTAQVVAQRYGWMAAARYTNLRDVRSAGRLGFLDIDWKRYDFDRHVAAARATRPIMTVARDIETRQMLANVLRQAEVLERFVDYVIIVPKCPSLSSALDRLIPLRYILGFSVPTRYGATCLPVEAFRRRPVHLLGGRPDAQRRLANTLNVVSIDCNRFTLDARFGDYFDGETFRPHPSGGYLRCLADSMHNIDKLWQSYHVTQPLRW